MEGGLLLHAAWLLSFTFVWVYRRWFEAVGPRDAAFEALCAERPALAVVRVSAEAEDALAERLRTSVGQGEVIASLGGWPWIHYVLGVEPERLRGALLLRITSCRLLRSHEVRPPALTAVLGELLQATERVQELWLHPGAYVDVSGRSSAPRGWHLRRTDAARPTLVPAEERPAEVATASATACSRGTPVLASVLLSPSTH